MSLKAEAIEFARDAVENAIDASIRGVERAIERRRMRTCERMIYFRKRAQTALSKTAIRYWMWLHRRAKAKCEAMREDASACGCVSALAALERSELDTTPIGVA